MVFYFVLSVILISAVAEAKKGACFYFNGNDYLKYDFDYVDITSSAWYKLTFKTSTEKGLILYAEGSHDYEALFIRGGKLHYFLFNPTPYGSGGTFGGSFVSDRKVNNDTWITVEVFRNRIPKQANSNEPIIGMVITSEGGGKEKHIETGERVGVNIVLPIKIAGNDDSLGDGGERFIGKIKDVREKNSGTVFNDPTWNSGASRCLDDREPM